MICLYTHDIISLQQRRLSRSHNAQTERKTGGIARRRSGAPEGRAARFPVARAEPDAPGAAAPQWLPAGSDEGLADVLQPNRANGRQHAMVCVILGILRKLLPGPV